MKFLPKNPQSDILTDGLVYKDGNTKNNRTLRERLLLEQKRFCAYTEEYITSTGSDDVEHFDRLKKKNGNDDYFNYYATTHKANKAKSNKDKQFEGASFFESLFFHDKVILNSRIKYVDGQFDAMNATDVEAKQLIEYLSLNDDWLFSERANHIALLRDTFADARYTKDEQKAYLLRHRKMQSFITAIEHEFDLDLSEVYQ
jgi:hypothetical protein